MAEETTLDAFTREKDDQEDEAGEETPREIRTTMAWYPEGAACVSCGESHTRLWRSEEGLVCPTCKPWIDE